MKPIGVTPTPTRSGTSFPCVPSGATFKDCFVVFGCCRLPSYMVHGTVFSLPPLRLPLFPPIPPYRRPTIAMHSKLWAFLFHAALFPLLLMLLSRCFCCFRCFVSFRFGHIYTIVVLLFILLFFFSYSATRVSSFVYSSVFAFASLLF